MRALGQPLLAIVITHPHSDHFNGTVDIDREWPVVQIYNRPSTLCVIRATEAGKRSTWTTVFGADYSQPTGFPNALVSPVQSISVD